MLARKINSVRHSQALIQLRTDNGIITSDPVKVTSDFATFLSFLYSRPPLSPLTLLISFFKTSISHHLLTQLVRRLMRKSLKQRLHRPLNPYTNRQSSRIGWVLWAL